MEKTNLSYNRNRLYASLLKTLAVLIVALFSLQKVAGQESVSDESKAQKRVSVSEENLIHTVKGRVVNSLTKEGFVGVRVSVVNTKITTMTTNDGTFEIKVPRLDVTFSLDAPGYQDQMVALRGRSDIEIEMLKQTNALSFYDENIFSNEGIATMSDFSQNSVSIDEDITSRLSGQLRGIIHSGMPGVGSAIFVRGLNSLNTSAQPLYVVDGVVWQIQEESGSIHSGFYNNPLALIDPKDVEKVTVLKEGSSIYGAKGSNGVVIIKTKRSRSTATDISVDLSFGYRTALKSIPVMKAEEYRIYASDILGDMYENTSAVEKYKFLDDDPSKSYYKANHNNTDWLDLINKGSAVQNYGISVKGGDDVALYAFSLGYGMNNSNIENTDFSRLNVRFNSDIKMTDRLKLVYDISFTQTESNVMNDGIDDYSAPVYLSLIKSPLYNQYQYNKDGSLSNGLSDVDELRVGNPRALTKLSIGESTQYGLNTSIRPSYTFGDDKLNIGVLFAYGWHKLNENSFTPDYGVAERPLINGLGEIYNVSRNMAQDRMDVHSSIVLDVGADWNALRNSLHRLNVKGGYRFYADHFKLRYANGHNTGSDNMTQLSNTSSNLRYSDGVDDKWNSMSWYANADYSFKNRYLFNVATAMDASSRFGEKASGALKMGGVTWGIFPSVSGGWVISSEEFMKDVRFINFLKLRLGYGMTGNDNISNYASRSYFSSVKYQGKAMGLILSNIGNEKLKWETTGMGKLGLDFSMFENRWSVRADVYSSKTKDLLTQKELNEIAGVKYFWSNDGELKNKGFEISTNIRVLNMRDWQLDFGASIGHYKNKISSLGNGSFITDVCGAQILTEEGRPAGVFYGYKTKGVFSTNEQANTANLSIRSTSGELIPFEAGDMYFDDFTRDNVIDEKDRQVIGDPNPDFYGNFNFNLTYKRFTLGALFTFSSGNDAYNALRANLEAGKYIHNQSTAMQNRWTTSGQITDIPRATYEDPMGNSRFSDRWIEDASYLRFKSVSLSYTLPLQLTFIQAVSVWGSVSNIYTFTKYLGADPEFSYGNSVLYQGVDAGLIAQPRSFNLGVKINL